MKQYEKDLNYLNKLNKIQLELNYNPESDFEEYSPVFNESTKLKDLIPKFYYITEKMNTSVISNKHNLFSNQEIITEINQNPNQNDIYFYERGIDTHESTQTILYKTNPNIRLDKLLNRINKFNRKLIKNYDKKG